MRVLIEGQKAGFSGTVAKHGASEGATRFVAPEAFSRGRFLDR